MDEKPPRTTYNPHLPIDEIEVWAEANARHRKISEDLEDLAENIRLYGLQHPITVQRHKDGEKKYRLIAGQRRLLACRLLERKDIRAFILDDSVDLLTAKVLSVSENYHRKQLEAKDMSDVCMSLFLELNKSVKHVSKRLGVSENTVRKYIGFYAAPESIKAKRRELNLTVDDVSKIGSYIEDPDKAVEIANYISELPRPEKERVIDRLPFDSDKPAKTIISNANRAKYREPIMVHFPEEYAEPLRYASESEKKDVEILVRDVMIDWLDERGYAQIGK